MKLSLVLATLNRPKEIRGFLDSLSLAAMQAPSASIELIIVDQSADDSTARAIAEKNFPASVTTRYERVNWRGLSRARNFGLNLCSGDVIGFPDDDCQYSEKVVSYVQSFFDGNADIDILSLGTRAAADSDASLVPKAAAPTVMTPFRHYSCSFTLFFRARSVTAVGPFDEALGVGSHLGFGAGEEEDFLWRAIWTGSRGMHCPSPLVFHPAKGASLHKGALERQFTYGCGYGYVLKKHRNRFSRRVFILKMLRIFLRPIKKITSITDFVNSAYGVVGIVVGYCKAPRFGPREQ